MQASGAPRIYGRRIPDGLGINAHEPELDRHPTDEMAEDGFRWERLEIIWSQAQDASGNYLWDPYDRRLEDGARSGLRPLIILFGNRRHAPSPVPRTDDEIAGFVDFARHCADRYKKYHPVWEIWNEPSHKAFWPPTPNADEYIKLAMATATALKAEDPTTQIAAPCGIESNFGFMEKVADSGLLDHIDEFSIHLYQQWQPETFLDYYERVKSLLTRTTHHVGIITSEIGYPLSFAGITPHRQAEYDVRCYLLGVVAGVDASFLYEWQKHPGESGEYSRFGLHEVDGSESDALVALKSVTHALMGYRLEDTSIDRSASTYLLEFSNGFDRKVVGWTAAGDPADMVAWNRNPDGDPNASVNVNFKGHSLHLTGMPQVWSLN